MFSPKDSKPFSLLAANRLYFGDRTILCFLSLLSGIHTTPGFGARVNGYSVGCMGRLELARQSVWRDFRRSQADNGKSTSVHESLGMKNRVGEAEYPPKQE